MRFAQPDFPLSLDGLVAMLQQNDISSTYRLLGYDYMSEMEFQTCSQGVDSAQRAAFFRRLALTRRISANEVRRLFNQINTFYAETWALDHLEVPPQHLVLKCNELVLFQQGKSVGLRKSAIVFGTRQDLDFLDPRRQFKVLRGISPRLLSQALLDWNNSILKADKNENNAVALAMAFIAIHPFSDGNGRIARMVFTWLMRRWLSSHCWLAEDSDGEFLRLGTGLQSTEHKMAKFLLSLCGGYNRVSYGTLTDTDSEDDKAHEIMQRNLQHLGALTQTTEFLDLVEHLRAGHHLIDETPRFQSLRHFLA
ncbi:MAG TPA: Fic family protein [Thermoanaerobaculia bacterium]|nr:Fic family protein [Thermoanaerobaculia bacterium]